MRVSIAKADLARVLGAVTKVVESRSKIPILSNVLLSVDKGRLTVTGNDLDIEASASIAVLDAVDGELTVSAKMLNDIVKKAGSGDVSLEQKDATLIVKSGRSRFQLPILPASDFPSFPQSDFSVDFDIDLAALVAPVAFAISTEETRFYLNGVFLHVIEGKLTVVATDGHRLARNMGPDAGEFTGVILPRKLVSILPKGSVRVSLSQTKIRIVSDDVTLVSKLIDGTFPDYQRVIPRNNDKAVSCDRDELMAAADRVSTISSERGRAVKLSIASGQITLTVNNPEAGSATDDVEAEYSGEPMEVGFNAQYVRDILGVLPAGQVTMNLADSGAPALVRGGIDGLTLVIMPMRVS
ncbi:DNA polymerase III subunit beta [Limoniibacter endophyticus]|uniref:Beta sliding clamp n=1 Tax=Limoniibacter endophyticus TaxID=1565040 RepID=A0A8J3DDV0_9HYPH|nr:DNA polymerase III subunit beta [Limoniibacter endophyticus]GHC61375.1 DNA polymerase III subunit beta [Limoniibacter endophyticus]